MAWMGAAIAGGVSILGDVMSQQGQQQTNAQQMAMMMQNEQWQTQMSDTAMQRRVADLKAAGLNPMLAIGQGGASVPGVGQPSLQNPSAAFGQLGNQVSNAMQLGQQQSQIDLNKAQAAQQSAQANKANVEAQKAAGVDTDVQKQSIAESQSRIALQNVQADAQKAQAGLSSAQTQVAQATLGKIQSEIALMGTQSDLNSAKANVENIHSMLQELDIQQQKAIMPSLIDSASNAATASHLDLFEKQALAEFFASGLGSASPAVNQIMKMVVASRVFGH